MLCYRLPLHLDSNSAVFAGGHRRPGRVGRIWAKSHSHIHTQSHNLRLGSAACLTLKVVLVHTMENVERTVKAAVPGSNDHVFSIQF